MNNQDELDRRRLAETVSAIHHEPSLAVSTLRSTPFRWGPLVVYELLGAGSFGEVYRAHDQRLARDVALKLRRAETGPTGSAHTFLHEARRLARVRHPNVLTIYGADVHNGLEGFWTDLVAGRTLEARIRDGGPVASEEAMRIGSQLCRALAAVHAAGMIHGDVTAANVMEDRTGTVLLMDFGAVTERHPARDLGLELPADPVVGTPLFTAPELLLGGTPSPSSDLYSLAVLLFRLVSGRYPVEAATVGELMDLHRRGERTRARDAEPSLPEWLALVIDRALASDPRDRYGSALELERALAGPKLSPNNLPASITRFIGRDQICREIAGRLANSRLVTLTGAGGCGKTRLAIEMAGRLSTEHPGGVWLVELASITNPTQVPFEVARMLGVRETPGRDIITGLFERLRGDRTLVILDNCERVVSGCGPLVRDLLQQIPSLRVIATSREPLRVAGEAIVAVPPLFVPEAGDATSLANAESVLLFADRAGCVRHDFQLTAENTASVLEICRRLDGIPLAIELAAARLRYFSVQEIARRLDDRFRFLTRGDRTTHERHRTLEALIDWSYEHLDPVEQTVLRRQAVFAGGWTLEAAEAVCSGDELDEADILDLLTRLVDRSLVDTTVDFASGSTRYRMLETIQTYARERLTTEERQAVLRRHRAYFLRLAETSEPLLRGPDQALGLSRLEADFDNLSLALTPDLSGPDEEEPPDSTEERVRLAGSLGRFWSIRGHWSHGAAVCAKLLANRRPDQRTAAWAKLLNSASVIATDQARYDDVRAFSSESLAIFREIGDLRHQAGCLNNLGLAAMWQGALNEAEVLWKEALTINRRVGNRAWESTNLMNLGLAAYNQKRFAEAREHLEGALALSRELGDTHVMAGVLDNLGNLADEEGRLEEARQYYDEGLELRRRIGDRPEVAISLGNLGCLMQKIGDRDRAWALAKESLEIKRELGNVRGTTYALEAIASLAMDCGQYERAVRLLGASDAIRESIKTPRLPVESAVISNALDQARTALGEEPFRSAYGAGRGLSVETAIEEALHDGP